jgi:hypothetical protein
MTTKTVVCPECDAPLSPGRFACPSCGALVASVATVPRSFSHADPMLPPILDTPIPDEPSPAPAGPHASGFDEPLPPRFSKVVPPVRRAAAPIRSEKPVPTNGVAAQPAARQPRQQRPRQTVASQQASLAWVLDEPGRAQLGEPAQPMEPAERTEPPQLARPAPPAEPVRPPPEPAQAARSEAAPAWPPSPGLESTQASSVPGAPSWPAHPTWPPPRPLDVIEPVQTVEPPATRVVAGAYLPPSAVLPPGELLPLAVADRRAESNGTGGRPAKERSVRSKVRLRLGDGTGPFGMPAEAPTRIVVLGAGISGFGFLLPWANYVIGHGKIGGYLDQWGLAGPGHVIILALIAAVAVLALFAAQMPRWVRVGLPSIGLACLLTGLVFPYLVGPYNALIGVYVVAVGAVTMIGGGLLDRIATRHAESAAGV